MLKTILFLSVVALTTSELVGGFIDREVDEEDVLEAVNQAVRTLSERWGDKFHNKLDKIVKAKSQVVAGVNYRLTFIVGDTNCRKDAVDYEDIDSCEFDKSTIFKTCNVNVFKNLRDEYKLLTSGCVSYVN